MRNATLFCLALLSLSASPAGAETTSVPAAGITRIEITTRSGAVRVEPATGDQIEIEWTRDAPKTARHGGRLEVDARHGDLRVATPPGRALSIRVKSGRVRVRGTYGRIEVRAASGNVALEVKSPEADLRTLSGDIEVGGEVAVLKLAAISGDTRVSARAGDVRATVTSGDLAFNPIPRRLDSRSVSGHVKLHGPLPRDAALDIESISGPVEIEPEGGAGYRLIVESRSDRVEVAGERATSSEGTVDVAVRGGGPTVRISTLSGRVDAR